MKALNRSFPRADPARWARPKSARLRDQPVYALTQEVDVDALRKLFNRADVAPGRVSCIVQPPLEVTVCPTVKMRPIRFVSHASFRWANKRARMVW